ncbi:MAG: tagaturonate reductase [Alicyclobacillus herbarius]|uniref:tagaturonate reductase n=1 Tax=Alicyclobacillus herbarius TaxID=122960 RepID=UPI0023533BE9|nr:tagaturonate reductase [Alicyclobacillus herbarius]MCL6633640.1 tagaturonate reductase [Alicyclobacillus herbarius]
MERLSMQWLRAHQPDRYERVVSWPERIIQFGEGNFLRGFADWLIDELNERGHFGGRIVVVAPRRTGAANVARLNAQDGLYTVWLRGLADGAVVDEARVVASVSRGLDPYADWTQILRLAETPEIDILISNTTERGLVYTEEAYRPNETPESFPAKVTAYLYHRYQHFAGDPAAGLTLIPCELVDDNGDLLRELVLRHAAAWRLPAGFSEWVNTANRFCHTLVDRILPGYPAAAEAEALFVRVGYTDELLTVGEPYHLWAISGDPQLAQRWPLAECGFNVHMTDDVTPFRLQKVRILNGLHTAMSALALLAGKRTVGDVMTDADFAAFVEKLAFREIIPAIAAPSLPEATLQAFARQVLERFRNPFLEHELHSITLNTLAKTRVRLVPTLTAYVERQGELPQRLVLALAGLLLYYPAARAKGWPIRDDEAQVQSLLDVWGQESELGLEAVVERLLADTRLWGADLTVYPRLVVGICDQVRNIRGAGPQQAIRQVVAAEA